MAYRRASSVIILRGFRTPVSFPSCGRVTLSIRPGGVGSVPGFCPVLFSLKIVINYDRCCLGQFTIMPDKTSFDIADISDISAVF